MVCVFGSDLDVLHEQMSLIWPDEAPYDYKSMKEIHMAEGDPRAGITEVGIDSPQGIEKARKVTSHIESASKPSNCTGVLWSSKSIARVVDHANSCKHHPK